MKKVIITIILASVMFVTGAALPTESAAETNASVKIEQASVVTEPVTDCEPFVEPVSDEQKEQVQTPQEKVEPVTESVEPVTTENQDADNETGGEAEDNMTVEEKVKVNRDPDSEVWHHIEDSDCPGHEWGEIEPNYDEDGNTWNSRTCLNCGRTEIIGEVERAEPNDSADYTEPSYDEDTCPGHEWDGPFLDVDEEGNEIYIRDCLRCGTVEVVENGNFESSDTEN